MKKERISKVRKVFCEVVEGTVYEDRCLFKLSQVIDGNPTCKECVLQEIEALKSKRQIPRTRCSKKLKRPKKLKKPKRIGEFYDSQEVSKLLNIPLRTIQEWAKKGKISSKKIGSKLWYPKAKIDQLVKEREKSNGSSLDQSSRTVDNRGRGEISESFKDDDLSIIEKGIDSGS